MTDQPDLFAAAKEKRDEAIAVTISSAASKEQSALLVRRVQARLRQRMSFTADDCAALLDEEEVPRTLALRRRLSSAIINGGRKFWYADGQVMSHDKTRNARHITLWRVRPHA